MSGPATVQLDAGNRGVLNLVFKFGTIRAAEQALGQPLTSLGGTMGFDAISAIFWAVLQPSLRITQEGSDDLIDELGVEAVTAKIGEGLAAYFGTAETGAGAGEGKAAKKGK